MPPKSNPSTTVNLSLSLSRRGWNAVFILLFVPFFACGLQKKGSNESSEEKTASKTIVLPSFDADSAYTYVERQVAFGPRVPGTPAHAACLDYLKGELSRFGAETVVQEGEMKGFDNRTVPVRNIVGVYNPDARRRILLCAHWDSRPWADHDPDPLNHQKPVNGADDGASGVGVLLEIARQLSLKAPSVGVDIVLFDSEDMGTPQFYTGPEINEHDWCLGAQLWGRRPHTPGYRASFGILLDMVGGNDAVFRREGVSQHFASSTLDKVWKAAQQLGYSNYFVNEKTGTITDDHLYVNQIAKIPCIDIVNYSSDREQGFPDYWHTTHDTMQNIAPPTLEAVGRTVLYVVYND